jgi:hypothetical protein
MENKSGNDLVFVTVNCYKLRGELAWIQSSEGSWYKIPSARTAKIAVSMNDALPSQVDVRWLDEYLEIPGVKVGIPRKFHVEDISDVPE